MNNEKEEAEYRSRTGRLEKWKELYAKVQRELQLPNSPVERLM